MPDPILAQSVLRTVARWSISEAQGYRGLLRTTSLQFRVPLAVRKFRIPAGDWVDVNLLANENRQKQNAGTRKAFRRLNYACLTLVGESDAKSRHSEILIVAAVTRPELVRGVKGRDAYNLDPVQ